MWTAWLRTGGTITVRARVDGAIYGVDFMLQFGAPVPSAVPSAGARQVQNLSINDSSLSSLIKAHQKVLPLWNDRHLDITSNSVTNL